MAVVTRCLEAVEILASHPDGLALGELAERMRVPKSAGHRLLTTLVERDWVVQDPVTRHYRLTMRLTSLGLTFLSSTHLPDVAQPVLDRLASTTGELARMTVAEDGRLIWVAKAQGARWGLRYDVETGGEPRLWCTATGHAWLATHGDDQALSLAKRQGWPEPGADQPGAPNGDIELLARMALARQKGWAAVADSGVLGMAAVAVAIPSPDAAAPAVGTVSIAGPSVRFTPARVAELAAMLLEAARELGAIWPIRSYQQRLTGAPTLAAAGLDR